ncbi:hypothetical protein QVD17_27261 [Tagetes erecta]|uniref:Uncharacterized protein n=1 Tax=Tagetes erecta TaxID=13708 RepID=A0AAD8KCT4_TARER|nr:hypothetical protein QVD17_27261 [Tagetes erecta]
MEAAAIATLVFIFAATALTVLITLCYKGGDRGGNNHHGQMMKKNIEHNKTTDHVVSSCRSRSQTNDDDIETGGADHIVMKNIGVSEPVAGYGGGGGS